MPNQPPLNPDARRAAFEAVQAIDGPASLGSMEVVDVAVSAYLAAQPVVTATIENFINQRPEYITALKGTSGTGDQGDYWRWSGGAEARRQLATMLGWTVPHEPGETTRPEVK